MRCFHLGVFPKEMDQHHEHVVSLGQGTVTVKVYSSAAETMTRMAVMLVIYRVSVTSSQAPCPIQIKYCWNPQYYYILMFNCCDNPHSSSPCIFHPDRILTLICANSSCMELLCIKCLQDHRRVHANSIYDETKLVDLREGEDYIEEITKQELKAIEDTQGKKHRPETVLYEYIDQHFYGSTQRRRNLLQARQKGIKQGITAKMIVTALEIDHEISLSAGFKQNYFRFLDELLQQASQSIQLRKNGRKQ